MDAALTLTGAAVAAGVIAGLGCAHLVATHTDPTRLAPPTLTPERTWALSTYGGFSALMGALFGALSVAAAPTAALPGLLYLAWLTITLTLIDCAVHRLPNAVVLPGYVATTAAVAAASGFDAGTLARAGAGAVALSLLFGAIMVIYPPGMGFGDVKLAVICGAFLAATSWQVLAAGTAAMFATGGIMAAGTLLRDGRTGARALIPFGPAMFAGVWVGLTWGQDLWDSYMALLT